MTTRTHNAFFPILRRLSDGRFHSGEVLAREHGLSRGSIFNVMALAESMGLKIHSVRGRGYRMAEPVEWLSLENVQHELGTLADAFTINLLDSVGSTNTDLMEAALNGADDGTVLCAEHQQCGKGRRGRTWQSAPGGGLTFSMLARFESGLQSLAGLSLAVGLAIARAINRHSIHRATLKWPNDVLANHRKLAGILVEVQGDLNGPAFAVIGVGLNVRLNAAQRDAVDQAVIDLDEMGVTVGRNRLLADCLQEMHKVLTQFRRYGFSVLREDWIALDEYAGKSVILSLPDQRKVHGVASGVDDVGALLLCDSDSLQRPYTGGEISLRLDAAR